MSDNSVYVQSGQTVVETRDAFSRHGEELIVARYGPGVADRGFTWPATGVTVENSRDREGIVARVDGAVVGRALLNAVFHPLAELVNLEIAPPYRGRGVGSAIVRHAIDRAAGSGFLAIHAQTFKDNVAAHRLYAGHGFLSATRGEMLRVWKFLNLPALAQFLYDHPLALFESRAGGDREHVLRWRDPGGEDELAVTITGGSCQFDGDQMAPAASALRLRSGPVRISASVEGPAAAATGETYPVRLVVTNHGSDELTGGFRIGLNPGFAMASGHPGGERFSLAAGASIERALSVERQPSFSPRQMRVCFYWSVPVTVDFLLQDHTFWLNAQLPIAKDV